MSWSRKEVGTVKLQRESSEDEDNVGLGLLSFALFSIGVALGRSR